jgi:hypothetical protein
LLPASVTAKLDKEKDSNDHPRFIGQYVGQDLTGVYIDTSIGFDRPEFDTRLAGMIVHVTAYDNAYNIGHRKLGYYKLRSATMEVSFILDKPTSHLHVKIKGDNVADVVEIRNRFFAGTIMPTTSFEEKQMPPCHEGSGSLESDLEHPFLAGYQPDETVQRQVGQALQQRLTPHLQLQRRAPRFKMGAWRFFIYKITYFLLVLISISPLYSSISAFGMTLLLSLIFDFGILPLIIIS